MFHVSYPPPLLVHLYSLNIGPLSKVKDVVSEFQSQDLDFGLDTHGLSLLLSGDRETAQEIVTAFGNTNGLYVKEQLH